MRQWRAIAAAMLALCWNGAAAGRMATAPAASATPAAYAGRTHPDWVKTAAIYELSLRQFTPEGTLTAAERQLPRLKALGVGIVWLMPIHSTGQERLIPPLGSPYAVRDFRAIDPAYGDLADLRRFVASAHALGLHVILDWVANHSAWDNPLVAQHPDWYMRGADGLPRSPAWFTWNDVVEFDYRSPGLRRYMADSMAYWVREADVDGFRADAAGLVPLDFWESVRAELDRLKPVFMLAEWDSRDLTFRAFDMTYGWPWATALEKIAAGHGGLDELRTYYAWDGRFWPPGAIRMLYVSNHDVIGGGTEFERYGPALHAAIALSVASEGMPLIFNGQEAGNRRRLSIFARDPIKWRPDPEGELYARLLRVRTAHRALWSRPWGGRAIEVASDDRAHVLAFSRSAGDDTVLAVFNLSPERRSVTLANVNGQWADALGLDSWDGAKRLDLPSWGYRLFYRAGAGGAAAK